MQYNNKTIQKKVLVFALMTWLHPGATPVIFGKDFSDIS
jgi:hypothetical protein